MNKIAIGAEVRVIPFADKTTGETAEPFQGTVIENHQVSPDGSGWYGVRDRGDIVHDCLARITYPIGS